MGNVYFEALAILVLILVNGFFALSEMALVAARKVRLKTMAEKGSHRAAIALKLKSQPDKFLSTAQIGITLVAILTGAISGATLAGRIGDRLALFPSLEPYSGPLGLALVVLPITFLTLILGELVPKRLAVGHPEKMSGLCAPSMHLLMRLSKPVVHLLSGSTAAVVRLLGIKAPEEPGVTEADIRGLIREAVIYGEVQHAERDLLERIFHLGDRQAGDLMTETSRIVWLNVDDPFEKNLAKILENPHSRFPVAAKDPSRVLGAIKAKEYLGACLTGGDRDLEAYLHQVERVPETERALRLLEIFRRKDRMHFALVVDEHEAPRGIVTFNDILEAIVGDIPSVEEFPEPAAVQREDGSWLLDGFMPLEDVQARLGIEKPMRDKDQTFHTLAGFVLTHMGHVPQMGEHFDWGDFRFEVVDMDGRRIDRILVSPLPRQVKPGDVKP